MDSGEEGRRVLGVAGGDPAPAFEVQKGVLHEMAQLVEVAVVFPEHPAVFPGRDHRLHALPFGLRDDGVAVVALVGNQAVRAEPCDEAGCKAAIRCGALCNKDSDRQTKRIHGQMDFGVEPPFERAMS